MFDSIFVGNDLDTLKVSPKFERYTGVRLLISDNESIFVGDESGRVMEVPDMPWGTKAIAENILRSLGSYQYQPFYAGGLTTDPALELGDAITASGIYGAIYEQDFRYDGLFRGSVSSPYDEDINHEIPYKPKADREYVRYKADTKSELRVQAGLIEAKVSQVGGTEDGSFSYEMRPTFMDFKASGKSILRLDAKGGKFTGDIEAENGYFHGNVYAKNIQHGGLAGTFNGSGITGGTVTNDEIAYQTIQSDAILPNAITGGYGGCIELGGITTSNTSSGINTTLAQVSTNADTISDLIEGRTNFVIVGAGAVYGDHVSAQYGFSFKNKTCEWATVGGRSVICAV